VQLDMEVSVVPSSSWPAVVTAKPPAEGCVHVRLCNHKKGRGGSGEPSRPSVMRPLGPEGDGAIREGRTAQPAPKVAKGQIPRGWRQEKAGSPTGLVSMDHVAAIEDLAATASCTRRTPREPRGSRPAPGPPLRRG
jgi:hypothetical protein